MTSQFFNKSSLGTANEAATFDGPSGLEVEDSTGCFFSHFVGWDYAFQYANYNGPVVKSADNLHIKINTKNRLFGLTEGNGRNRKETCFSLT